MPQAGLALPATGEGINLSRPSNLITASLHGCPARTAGALRQCARVGEILGGNMVVARGDGGKCNSSASGITARQVWWDTRTDPEGQAWFGYGHIDALSDYDVLWA